MVDFHADKNHVAEQGKRMYAERLRANAERDHWGQFLVLDIQSGDFEIAPSDTNATLSMLERRPDAVLYGIRIGDEVAYRFGQGTIG